MKIDLEAAFHGAVIGAGTAALGALTAMAAYEGGTLCAIAFGACTAFAAGLNGISLGHHSAVVQEQLNADHSTGKQSSAPAPGGP